MMNNAQRTSGRNSDRGRRCATHLAMMVVEKRQIRRFIDHLLPPIRATPSANRMPSSIPRTPAKYLIRMSRQLV
ncbi:hypothetical protein VTL71DRAFT_11297 [Oculimacula yallundae]|uniref:Uncharacterized protein n=1 Tax=Oculimacula yallundae TaxID=86028 RepID=A0ABR4CQ49_9HELO